VTSPETAPSQNRKPGLTIPWAWLSVGLFMLAISAIGTLAVITKRTNADTLSTIALALAVLAFALSSSSPLLRECLGHNSLLKSNE
jgi:hypothetical protein